MLPIAILPIADLLLRLSDVDLLNIPLVHDAGEVIFASLVLIFVIGVAVGFIHDNNGIVGLVGAIGYLVMIPVLEVIDPGTDMGVFSGIVSGLVAGALYNRFKDVKLPKYLTFFGGRRFVPIATRISAVCLGLLFGVVWPPLQQDINDPGQLMLESSSFGAFAFDALNHLLIVTGLHHIPNNLVWFVFGSFADSETGRVVTSDLAHYFVDDSKGGQFTAGMFPVMMFGLPAVCLAMYRSARPERRRLIGGLLLSMALTAFLTDTAELMKFVFMFLAPLLCLLHALFTGLSMTLIGLLDTHLGFAFSNDAVDLVLSQGRSTHDWILWPLGLLYTGIYYLAFDFCIHCFSLKAPGREDDVGSKSSDNTEAEHTPAFIRILGGAADLETVDACTAHLRLRLVDYGKASGAQLEALGATAVVHPGRAGSLQVMVGPQADSIADEIRCALPFDTQPDEAVPPLSSPNTAEEVVPMQATVDAAGAQAWLSALGGAGDLREVRGVALTRLWVSVAGERKLATEQLRRLGEQGVSSLAGGICHILVGPRAVALSQASRPLLRR